MSDLITKRDPVQIALEIVDGTRGPEGFDDAPFKHLKVLADEVLRLRKEPSFKEAMEWMRNECKVPDRGCDKCPCCDFCDYIDKDIIEAVELCFKTMEEIERKEKVEE